MPYKDHDEKLASQRRHYAAHREEVIAKVNRRKWELYGGTCRNCGAPTMGETKGAAAEWCHKPACRRAQLREKRRVLMGEERVVYEQYRWADEPVADKNVDRARKRRPKSP